MNDDELPVWTIYFNPTDYPERYVVRRFLVGREGPVADTAPTAVIETLDEARRAVPKGLICLERSRADELQIIETWL